MNNRGHSHEVNSCIDDERVRKLVEELEVGWWRLRNRSVASLTKTDNE